MKLPNQKQLEEFEKWGVEPPKHEENAPDSFMHPVSERIKQANCWNWRLEVLVLRTQPKKLKQEQQGAQTPNWELM